MKNWKDYVGFQQITDWFWHTPEKIEAFYLISTNNDNKVPIYFRKIDRKTIAFDQFVYGEDDIGDVVESLLYTFPKWKVEEKGWDDIIARINIRIAQNSRRGVGNSEFESDKGIVCFYSGTQTNGIQNFDRPIIVSQYYSNERGKVYCITKHPDFDKYGFVVEKMNGVK